MKKQKEIRYRTCYMTGSTIGEIEYKDDVDKAYKLRALSKVLRLLELTRGE